MPEATFAGWHFDHCVGRNVKGINFLTCLYRTDETALPVAYQLIQKSEWETDKKTEKLKRVCPKTKNEYFREMVTSCKKNQLPFRYVLADSWFASTENMVYLRKELDTDFIFPLKENRKVALSEQDKSVGRYVTVTDVSLKENAAIEILLERVDFPLLLCKQVFTNKDGSQGVLYLVTSDTSLDASDMQAIYQKRWKQVKTSFHRVEEYHKSVKSNASFAKSPTKTIRTQSNHVFACLWSYIKLESLHWATKMNHFAMKSRLYRAALVTAYQELQTLKLTNMSA